MQLFRNSAETQIFRNFYADLGKRKFSAAFTQLCKYAAFMQTCVKAAKTQVFGSFYIDLRKSCAQKPAVLAPA